MLLTDMLWGKPSRLWKLTKQIGINDVVGLLDGGEQDQRMFASIGKPGPAILSRTDAAWGHNSIKELRDRFAAAGFSLKVIEDNAPLDHARLGGARRDEQIENFRTQVQAMGMLGVPTLCYNWMALSSWARTNTSIKARGGALVTGYNELHADNLGPVVTEGSPSHDQLWTNLAYFLDAVVPVAEEWGVRLAMHPDDPPRPMVRGVARIMSRIEDFDRLLDLYPSASNAITLCQGNFALMTDQLPSTIEKYLKRDAVAFVHMRDVRGTAREFVETFHDDGQTDLVECMAVYANRNYKGPMRADHVPTLAGESNSMPGYETLGRLYANGYLRGLISSAYR